ncbi:UNVERIFIED_CONTAM: hypothetical protein NCL1_45441 [Trichonephila clavipes]
MAASISSNASDMAYNNLMNGAPFVLTSINKSMSEIKETILDVRLPKQKNQRGNSPGPVRAYGPGEAPLSPSAGPEGVKTGEIDNGVEDIVTILASQ